MSYIIGKANNGYGPKVAHHPTCPHAARIKSGIYEMFLPPGAVLCNHCNGVEYFPSEYREARYEIERLRRSHKGRYQISRRGDLVPCECPACGWKIIERDSQRLWFCWKCPWMGQVNRKTWTLVKGLP